MMPPKKPLNLLFLTSLLILVNICDKAIAAGEDALSSTKAKSASAEPVASPEVQTYGAGVEDIESISISDIAADPEAFDGRTVRIEGMVTDVCSKRGCWIEMAGGAAGKKARFKVKDGEMVFPMSAKGKQAVAQGKVVAQKLSIEEARALEKHYAEEAGREFDPESITEGRTVFRIQGTGAVITD